MRTFKNQERDADIAERARKEYEKHKANDPIIQLEKRVTELERLVRQLRTKNEWPR